jgi:hypothetical protein
MKKFRDKHGCIISSGDTICNPFDANPFQKVELIQGEFWFGSKGTTIYTPNNNWCKMHDRYGFDKFWEIIKQ